jgi:hypothetical protein
VARLIFPGTLPLLAPLTALLVVQVTPVSLLASIAVSILTILLLATADRLLRELDYDERARRTPPRQPQWLNLRPRRDRRAEP